MVFMWLFILRQSIQCLSVFVHCIKRKILLGSCNNREAGRWTTPLRAVGRTYLTRECGGTVHPERNVGVGFADVLEVVDMATTIDGHILMLLQHREQIFLHIGALHVFLRRLRIDRMVSYTDHPVLVGCRQRAVYPSQLPFAVLLVSIGIGGGVVAVAVHEGVVSMKTTRRVVPLSSNTLL